MTIAPVKITELCEVVAGGTPDTGDARFWGGDICWATPKDLSELDGPEIVDTPRKLTKAGLDSSSATVLPAGSVLFSSRAPIGLVAINRVPMATNQGFKSFVPRPGKVESSYLYHWLRANRPRLEALGNGATFKEVSKSVVERIELPVPWPNDSRRSLAEQKRIAAILDKTDALRRKRREAIAAAKHLIPSQLLDMFGDPVRNPRAWPVRRLGDLVPKNDTINYGVVQPGNDVTDGVPIVRVGDFDDMSITVKGLKRIDPAIEAQYKRSRLVGDEVLIACVGSIGLIALADERLRGFNIVRAVARVRCGPEVNRVYLAWLMLTDQVQRQFTRETRTVSQPTLNIRQIEETSIMLPPIDRQNEFALLVEQSNKYRHRLTAAVADAEVLFNSLVQRAFRGEL